jgi:hypothetical protein
MEDSKVELEIDSPQISEEEEILELPLVQAVHCQVTCASVWKTERDLEQEAR